MRDLSAIVLAAGKGVRMNSPLPKCFHKLAGKPLLQHVLETIKELGIKNIYVVVGHQKEVIEDYFKDWPVTFVHQKEQLGTGHAVMICEEEFKKNPTGSVLVLAGDVPLLKAKTLRNLIDFHIKNNAAATDLTAELPDAGNYGRILRDSDGRIVKIVEKKDATPEELAIKEINTGTFCFDSEALFFTLKEVKADNAQKEYYLTDTIGILRQKGKPVFACLAPDYCETLGINTPQELIDLERHCLRK